MSKTKADDVHYKVYQYFYWSVCSCLNFKIFFDIKLLDVEQLAYLFNWNPLGKVCPDNLEEKLLSTGEIGDI